MQKGVMAAKIDTRNAAVPHPAWLALRDAALVGGIVMAASLFGILTRPVGFLAAFWPANALLLGLFVRLPHLRSPSGWLGALLGYLAADLITGGNLSTTAWLTAANLTGVGVGCALFAQLGEDDRRLRRPLSVLYLFAIAIAAATACAMVGSGVGRVLLGQGILISFAFWLSNELVTYITVLPVMMAAPRIDPQHSLRRRCRIPVIRIAPFLTLLVSIAAALMVGGPGTIAFPVPALLWCALTYSLFTTVVLTLILSVYKMIAIASGFVPMAAPSSIIDATTSMQLGIALLALGPLTVASINTARNELLRALEHATNHDSLTGALSRSAFLAHGQRVLDEPATVPTAVMMLDIDHFKRVNDVHGHAAGDQVLVAFAAAVSSQLRQNDAFGRLGGEEFGLVLRDTSHAQTTVLAARLREHVAGMQVALADGTLLHITVSIGMATRDSREPTTLTQLLSWADGALYRAKAAGRNQVACHVPEAARATA